MAKLSRKQIREARTQARLAREKALEEEMSALDSDDSQEEESKNSEKKDSLGLTSTQRTEIKKNNVDSKRNKSKITWQFDPGDLVHLPGGEVGMIVENNAIGMDVTNMSHDKKKTLKANKYSGQVYVVTSSGNNWYYPRQLKVIR